MQILLNLAEFGPLSTSVAISANGMVGRLGTAGRAWQGKARLVGRRGRARMARRVWLAGVARHGRLGAAGSVGRRGEAWLGRDGTARLAGNCPARTFRAGLISRRGIL